MNRNKKIEAVVASMNNADIIAKLRQRVELCDMYISRNSRSLRSHQWVVVSTVWNQRIVYLATVNGIQHNALGPCDMPTCWTERAATILMNGFNDQFEADGNTERVFMVQDTHWWKTERQSAIDSIAVFMGA